ncbi:MAG: DUF1778 domain-containing protein [Caulobacteraceae bacterium]
MSEFVLESALARAEEALPDRRRFGIDAERWARFQAALDAPPRPLPRLGELLAGSSVIERAEARCHPGFASRSSAAIIPSTPSIAAKGP